MEKLGQRLRELRQDSGLSQSQVAKLVGVSRNAVSQWESGETIPNSRRLARVAKALGVPLREIARASSSDQTEDILGAIARLLPGLGHRGLSADIICATAEVPRSEFDARFGTPERAVAMLFRRHHEGILEEARRQPPIYGSVLARLKYFFRSMSQVELENTDISREFHAAAWTGRSELQREYTFHTLEVGQLISDVLLDAAERGQIRRDNLQVAAELLLGAYTTSLRQAQNQSLTPDQLVTQMTPQMSMLLISLGFEDIPGFSEKTPRDVMR